MKRTAIVLIMSALLAFATPAFAQFIDIKTVPIATGEQFLIYPSRNLGFGGLSLAVRDPLGDPFANPAKGSALPDHASSARRHSTTFPPKVAPVGPSPPEDSFTPPPPSAGSS